MSKIATLRDEMFEVALVAIRCQEGFQPVVKRWRLIDAHGYELIASVTVAIEEREFDVWVVVNIDTEEV